MAEPWLGDMVEVGRLPIIVVGGPRVEGTVEWRRDVDVAIVMCGGNAISENPCLGIGYPGMDSQILHFHQPA